MLSTKLTIRQKTFELLPNFLGFKQRLWVITCPSCGSRPGISINFSDAIAVADKHIAWHNKPLNRTFKLKPKPGEAW